MYKLSIEAIQHIYNLGYLTAKLGEEALTEEELIKLLMK